MIARERQTGGHRRSGAWCWRLGVACVLGALCAPAQAQYGLSVPPVQSQVDVSVEVPDEAEEQAIRDPAADAERARRIRDLAPGLHSLERFAIGVDPRVLPSDPLSEEELVELLDLEVELALAGGVWRAPDEALGAATERIAISGITARSNTVSREALRVIGRSVEEALLSGDPSRIGWVSISLPRPPPASPSLDVKDQEPLAERVATMTILFESLPMRVDELLLKFVPEDQTGLPDAATLLDREVTFGVAPDGALTRPTERFESRTLRLNAIDPETEFYTTGLLQIVVALTDALRIDEDLVGILLTLSPDQVDVAGGTYEDQREGEDYTLSIDVYLSVVRQFRTLAFGDRVKEEDRENAKVHERIVRRSTVKEGDLLRRDKLDEYLHRLNRMSGRRVSAALSAAEEEGVQVDYLISERRPLLIYGQISNTGTEQTDRLRYRFGGQISQLANLDDTLTLDYINAGLSDETQGFLGQYESDIPGTDRFRYRLEVAYSEFVASDVGLAGEQFTGDSTRVAAGVIWNVYQKGELFVDLLAGARWQHVSVDNEVVDTSGDSDFFVPRLGARVERRSRVAETTGYLTIEFNLAGVANTADVAELEALGRIDIDRDWTVLRWGMTHSFYLEPLLQRAAWEDVSTPKSSTLAHEVKLAVNGQSSQGTRLIPQEEQVVGCLFTVRGYPESVVSGDNVLIVSGEYRFHVPRALAYSPSPGELFGKPFRWRPQEVYGEADWDFILKAFVDAAWVDNQDRLPFETEDNLLGVGVGAEFSFRRNLFVRVDWGFALEALEERDQPVDEGDNEVHFVVTVLF